MKGTAACQESDGQAQVLEVARRGTRVIWRKLNCLNPNLQKMQGSVRRKGTRYRRRALRRMRSRPSQPSERGALPSEGNQGDEWDAYVTLGRLTATNAGSPTGREPHGHGVPIVVVRFTPHHQPAIDRPPRDPRHPRDRRDPPTPMRARLRSTPPPPATLIKRRAHRLPPHRDRALIDHTTKFNTPP